MLPVLHLGPLALRTPGLLWLLGLYLGLTWADRRAPRLGLTPNHLDNLTVGGLIVGVVTARLGYILGHLGAFPTLKNWLALDPALLDPWMAGVGVFVFVAAYLQRHQLTWGAVLDALAPLMVSLALTSALASLAAGTAFGLPTNLPWGIRLADGVKRHPTQVYVFLGYGLLALDLWGWGRGRGWVLAPGVPGALFWRTVAGLAGWRLFVEAWRGDSVLVLGGLRQAQVAAWLVLAVSLAVLTGLERKARAREAAEAQRREV
ncbi:MAG TPA: prolipoprotein diacylglyceryl transferase [Anaerolineae bacterium]|nr:prolipoprotein diacylglyceryl transferase [Anaerolineae bacterium]HID85503.1 hypothetical protein [Anaerolineales bacterium]HIQ09665.1 hypothetical protein [Anaerolineaceae bacterium]